jgi:hypothetical protein
MNRPAFWHFENRSKLSKATARPAVPSGDRHAHAPRRRSADPRRDRRRRPGAAAAGADDGYISFSATPGGFPLVAGGKAAPIVVSASDHPGVVRAVGDLQADVERVTGVKPAVATDEVPAQSDVVLVGTIGKSPLVDKLVIFPALQHVDPPAGPRMGVAIDGSERWWPAEPSAAVLPTFSPYQSQPAQYLEVFNRGSTAFDYRIRPAARWVKVTPSVGRVAKQVRATVRVDWRHAPKGSTRVPIAVSGPDGSRVVVQAVVENPRTARAKVRGFVEATGYVSMEAAHASRLVNSPSVAWKRIPDIGRTGDGMEPFPVTAPSQTPGAGSPRLEYDMTLFTKGQVKVWAYLLAAQQRAADRRARGTRSRSTARRRRSST